MLLVEPSIAFVVVTTVSPLKISFIFGILPFLLRSLEWQFQIPLLLMSDFLKCLEVFLYLSSPNWPWLHYVVGQDT